MESPTLLAIFGGVALLVFGVRYLRKGLDRLVGQRLGPWMQRLASRRRLSFLTGLAVSLAAPSSTTMSLLAVHTVQAGHMTARQMLTIMLGANIGLTVMVLLIALRLEQLAPVLVLIGVALFQFTHGRRTRGIGQVVLAIGFIFLAIDIMKRAAAGLPTTDGGLWEIINFEMLVEHGLVLAVFAALMAMVLQSSTATIGLVIGLASAEAISCTRRLGTMLVNRLPGPRMIRSASLMALAASGWAGASGGTNAMDLNRSVAVPTRDSPSSVWPDMVLPTMTTSVEVAGITRPRMANSSPAISTPL